VGTFAQGSNTYAYGFVNVTTNHTLAASFGIDTGLVAAAHTATAYAAMATNTIQASVSNLTAHPLLALEWTPALPPGWALHAAAGDGAPVVTNGSSILFTGGLASNWLQFSYTVIVPFGQQGSNRIGGAVRFLLQDMVSNEWVTATPAPLALYAYHAADFQGARGVIDGSEVNRVLGYWRAGLLHVDAVGADGYGAGAGATNAPRHAADYRAPFWLVDGVEANRVLAYWRAGAYHVDAAGLDGYAPGGGTFFLAPMSLAASAAAGALVVEPAAAALSYDPGQPVDVDFNLHYGGRLLGLAWELPMPPGWVVQSISGDGKPEFRHGEALWVGPLPESPVHLRCTLRPPLNARGIHVLRGTPNALFADMDNAVAPTADNAVVLAARDADGDALPDAWESYYGGSAAAMDPGADVDLDGHNNLAESIAGTDPLDPRSRLWIADLDLNSTGGVMLSWASVSNRAYDVWQAGDLNAQFLVVTGGVPATPPANVLWCREVSVTSWFYRIEVVKPK
jgi:hypothetical protein